MFGSEADSSLAGSNTSQEERFTPVDDWPPMTTARLILVVLVNICCRLNYICTLDVSYFLGDLKIAATSMTATTTESKGQLLKE